MNGSASEILFEKFEIIEVLKKDEHAAVYLANHIYLSKKIILKVLNTQKLPDQALIERFKREAKLLAKLDHSNIIKVLDFGTSKEYFYISFEYIEGTSLRNILNTKELTLDQKKQLMIQLLKALHYAHSFQIIHRDIKPENVFIDNNLNLKLGDFGLALSSEDNFVTNPYSIVGTPSYMSPEQVRGARLTPQSDLFSTGVLLFELFTGKNPFLKENVTLTLNEIMSYSEDSLEGRIKELPEEIRDVIYRLLRKKPEQRYQNAQEALNDMNVSLEQQTLVINRDGKKIKQERTKMVAVIAALVIIFTAIIAIQVFNKNEKNKIPASSNTTEPIKDSIQKAAQASTVPDSAANKQQILNKQDEKPIDKPPQNILANNDREAVGNDDNKPNTYGALFVECEPGGDIYIDGEKIGTAPMRQPLTLDVGEHNMKLMNPDYPPYNATIAIRHGEETKIRVLLDTLMAYIKCDVFPWGDVYVNGDNKGITPLPELIKVRPGYIKLTVKNRYHKEIDTTIYANKNDTLKLQFTFK